jgi:hypothetical protein
MRKPKLALIAPFTSVSKPTPTPEQTRSVVGVEPSPRLRAFLHPPTGELRLPRLRRRRRP